MNRLMDKIPPMLTGNELEQELTCLPEYDPNICKADAGTRLVALNQLSEIYIPSQMSYEIYSKIYLAMLHSLYKKQTDEAVRQGNENHRKMQGLRHNSVLGGSDSFSIIGKSGIYQYIANPSPITPEIIETLYQCSNGVIGLVISLVMESQQMAILSGRETLIKDIILDTFYTRMKNLQNFIAPEPKAGQTATIRKEPFMAGQQEPDAGTSSTGTTIKELAQQAREEKMDIVALLKASGIKVMEVAV